MRKILEYSDFVSGESEKRTPEYLFGELLRMQTKWFEEGGSSIKKKRDLGLIHKDFVGLFIEIGRLIPLDSDDAEKIAKTLREVSLNAKIGYGVYYILNYGISELNSPNRLVETFPIKWTEVK